MQDTDTKEQDGTQEEFDASFENGDMGIPATSGDANEETAE